MADMSMAPAILSLTEHRHIPLSKAFHRSPSTTHHRHSQAKIRAWRVRHEASQSFDVAEPITEEESDDRSGSCETNEQQQHRPRELKPYQLAALASHYHFGTAGSRIRVSHRRVHRVPPVESIVEATEEEEENEVENVGSSSAQSTQQSSRSARSRVTRSGCKGQVHRPPSLERQEAFCDETTSRRSLSRTVSEIRATRDDADDVELYRLGLLYDDEHERGSGFGLNTIVHDAVSEPVYTVSYQHSIIGKRSRRGGHEFRASRRGTMPSEMPDMVEEEEEAEEEDTIMGRHLITPPAEEMDVDDDISHISTWKMDESVFGFSTLDASSASLVDVLPTHDIIIDDNAVVEDDFDEFAGNEGDWAFLEKPWAIMAHVDFSGDAGGNDDTILEKKSRRISEPWVVLG